MYSVPDLSYPYDALEPYIDAQTMHLHHDKHHAAYVVNVMKLLEPYPELQSKSVEDLLSHVDDIPVDIRQGVINNAGGHLNHSLFWESLSPTSSKVPMEPIASALDSTFGTFEQFKEGFVQKGMSQFGSGWVWLVMRGKELVISSTANQDSPCMTGDIPLLGVDVWEHAYYLLYTNRRADYLAAIWNIINWDTVNDRYQKVA